MDVTIVIPTKNGGQLFGNVLERIFSQKTTYSFEVVCVDSGSTDNTLEIARQYPCKIFEISPDDFGHGKTRNYGASMGTGNYIMFLTQDALPADDQWIQNFIDAMEEHPDAVGGFGRHIPYEDCNVLDKRDIVAHFKGFGDTNTVYKIEDRARYKTDEGYRHFLSFYSDNNSCMRRDIWCEHPYPDVEFAEDQIWARQMLERGYKKLYCENAAVYHSHNYPLATYFSRYYDEYKSLYNLHQYQMVQGMGQTIRTMMTLIKRDINYICRNGEISNKLYWIYYAIRREMNRCVAAYIAGEYHNMDASVQEYFDCKISQQYKQITGESANARRPRKNKEVLKWIFCRQDDGLAEAHQNEMCEAGKEDIYEYFDYICRRNVVPFQKNDYLKYKETGKIINWVIPEMGVGSGGHINIFRFVNYMQQMGFDNRLYITNSIALHTKEDAKAFLDEHYDLDENVEVHVGVKHMLYAHATVATSWHTAYVVRDFHNTISKFYFVQDFEPFFYPVGSEYAFAENTYRFGFRGITAGDWLRDKLHNEYGMWTRSFGFSYDHNMYQPGEKRDEVKRIFFYARPVTPRRDFELGLLALDALANRIPDIEVVFAGWDVSSYRIDFNYKNMGSMQLEDLSDLYAQCDLCLVLSHTNLSLLPLEVMASNSVAVCSKGANSNWLVDEKNAVLVDYDVENIADTLEYYLFHPEELSKKRERGLVFAQNTSWDMEAQKVKAAFEQGIKEDEECLE